MGPYKQDYEIAQLKFLGVASDRSTIAIVRLFYIRSATDPLPIQILKEKTVIKDGVILESIFSDCVGFTPISEALAKFTAEHTHSLKAFLSAIEQDVILLYGGSEERYLYTMMSLIVDIAKEIGKKVVCIASNPPDFMRLGSIFEVPWENVESNAYKAILLDSSQERDEFIKLNEQVTIQECKIFSDQILFTKLCVIAELVAFLDINALHKIEAIIAEKTKLITFEGAKIQRQNLILKRSEARLQEVSD